MDKVLCSVIIPTIGRETLIRAVTSVLEQEIDSHQIEVIIVNDSGKPLPEAAWQHSLQVRIIHTQRRRLCVARNAGASVARGQYLHFLDDDDWLLPDALITFQKYCLQSDNTPWFYGGAIFVGHDDRKLGSLNIRTSGNCFLDAVSETWIPVQASLISADVFFQVGGFDPQYPGTEDLDLLRRIALIHDIQSIPENVVCIRRLARPARQELLIRNLRDIRRGRDNILNESGSYRRLVDSSGNLSLRRGILLRIYLAAMMEAVRNRQWTQVMSRGLFALFSLVSGPFHLFAPKFWRAVRRSQPWYYDLIEDPSPDFQSVTEWLF